VAKSPKQKQSPSSKRKKWIAGKKIDKIQGEESEEFNDPVLSK